MYNWIIDIKLMELELGQVKNLKNEFKLNKFYSIQQRKSLYFKAV